MKDETKRLIGLLWASKGHMIVGLGRIDPEKTKEIVAEMECKD